MQQREATPSASKKVVIISPNSRMADELDVLLEVHMPGVQLNHLRSYPSPRDLGGTIGSGAPQVVFLDIVSDHEQAIQLLSELIRSGLAVQVIALLSGNDPDLILGCLRAGAVDFLIQPFTVEQIEPALAKLARLQPSGEGGGKEPAKIFAVMPAKGACGATTIACNLAFQFKRLGAKRILLADLDPLAGTMSFLLKIKSVYSFLDTLQHAFELEAGFDGDASGSDVVGVRLDLEPHPAEDVESVATHEQDAAGGG